jgi:hypothetical protein
MRVYYCAFAILVIASIAAPFSARAECPPNSHPYFDDGQTVHCACNAAYRLTDGVCVYEAGFDNQARRWIERGFASDTCDPPGQNGHDLTNLEKPEALYKAWKFLQACRAAGNSSNLYLAAAENYLYIRYVANATGDTGFRSAPQWYYTMKVCASKIGFLDFLKTSTQPVSDPSPDVLRWGNFGYADGIRDYETRTGQKASLKTTSLIVALKFLADRYY